MNNGTAIAAAAQCPKFNDEGVRVERLRDKSSHESARLPDARKAAGSDAFLLSVLIQAEGQFIGKTSLGRTFTMIFASYATLFLATGNST